ncbi:MAG TPA: hypothetical protein P5514_12240 [Bacteroidales bacterium]|nr:hypothetical protein [Bacteroidales bacterium]HRX97708.1 hypothetical protein [Bacteroidales bacterium]
MAGLIILGIILGFFAWLLLAPLYLYIHTGESRYEAGMRSLFKGKFVEGAYGLPEVRVTILFYSFQVPVVRFGSEKKKQGKAKSKKKKSKKSRLNLKTIRLILKIVWKVMRSFKLKKFSLNIDTGNVITNAYLFPVFAVFGGRKYQLSVNYASKNEFIIHYQNNLLTILSHIIVTFINHKLKR